MCCGFFSTDFHFIAFVVFVFFAPGSFILNYSFDAIYQMLNRLVGLFFLCYDYTHCINTFGLFVHTSISIIFGVCVMCIKHVCHVDGGVDFIFATMLTERVCMHFTDCHVIRFFYTTN